MISYIRVPILEISSSFLISSSTILVICSAMKKSHIARNVLPTAQGELAVAKLSSFLLQIFQLFDRSGRGCFTFREVYTQLDIILLFISPKSVAINIKNLVPSLRYFTQARLCYESGNIYEDWFCGVCQYAQLVAVLGSISKDANFECRMKSAYNACCLQNEGTITPTAVSCTHVILQFWW